MPVRLAPDLDFRPERLYILRVHAQGGDIHQRCAGIRAGERGTVQEPAVERACEADEALHEGAGGGMGRLNLVTQPPCQHRRVVPVPEDHLPQRRRGEILIGVAREYHPGGLDKGDLFHREETVPVAQIEHVGVGRVPHEPDEVRAERLDKRDVLLPLFICHRAPPPGGVLVPANAPDLEPFPVELQVVTCDADAPDPRGNVIFIDDLLFFRNNMSQKAFDDVEVRRLRCPELRTLQDDAGRGIIPFIPSPDQRDERALCNQGAGHLVHELEEKPGRPDLRTRCRRSGAEAVRTVRGDGDGDLRVFAVLRRVRSDNGVPDKQRGGPQEVDVACDPSVVPHPPGRRADGKRPPRIQLVAHRDTDGVVTTDLEDVPLKRFHEACISAAVRCDELTIDSNLRGMVDAQHHDVEPVLVELFFRQLNTPLEYDLAPEVIGGGDPDCP